MRVGIALVVLLAATAGCGGGHQQVDAGLDARPDVAPPPDLGPEDRPVQDDVLPPQDAVVPPDGPACDPGGGHVTGSLCTLDLDCQCPRTCLRLQGPPASGSCWQRCDPAANDASGQNPACQSGETCLAGAEPTGGCLPRGTLSGTFDVPVYTAPDQPASAADLGTAAVTLDVGLIGQMEFASGWGTTTNDGTRDVVRLYLFPGSGATVDWDKPLIVDLPADASYQAGADYDLAASPATARIEYHEYTRQLQALARDVERAVARAGAVHVTAAGSGGRSPAQGSITAGSAVEYEAELCGESTTPCE